MNLDMDVGDLLKSLFSRRGKSVEAAPEADPASGNKSLQPYKKPLMIGAAVLLFFAAFMAGVYSPYSTMLSGKKTELLDKQDKQAELLRMDSEARKLEEDLVASKEYYTDLLDYFGDNEDLGYLYESVSSLAMVNHLLVLNVKEAGSSQARQLKNDVVIRENQVEVELKGSYLDYMSFKQALAQEKALINIFSENIKVLAEGVDVGKVSAKLKLLVYTIDKEPFRQLLVNIRNMERTVASNE